MVALSQNEVVFKRITYTNKIRDYRPSQYTPENTATYNADIREKDLLYSMVLQTSLSKYVEARNDESPSSVNPMFEPEIPYNSSELETAVYNAIREKLKRFHASAKPMSSTS